MHYFVKCEMFLKMLLLIDNFIQIVFNMGKTFQLLLMHI